MSETTLEEHKAEEGWYEGEEGDFEEIRDKGLEEYLQDEGEGRMEEVSEEGSPSLLQEGSEEDVGQEFVCSEDKSLPKSYSVTEKPKFWWRTSGYNLDDFDLPEDPEKANLKLQAVLVEELKKRDKYVKKIKGYFNKDMHKSNVYNELKNKDLNIQKTYQEELKNFKQILETFSDSYDDLNFRLTKQIKKCDKNEKFRKFFKEASRKILQDAQKKVDKKELEKYTKKQGLDKMLEAVYQWEDRYQELLLEKALITLEIEQVKNMVAGGEEEEVDILQLAELHKQVSIGADLKLIQELHMKKMQNIVASSIEKLPSKFLHMRYNLHRKDCTTGDLLKRISKTRQERVKILHDLKRTELLRKNASAKNAKNTLKKLDYYINFQA